MTFLLDVNALIALIDPSHVDHDLTHRWFAREGAAAWATCPLTENGVARIVSNPKYPNGASSPATVLKIVAQFRQTPGHVFWPDDISLIGADHVDPDQIRTSGQITDTYLLALAVARGGRLATLDRRLSPMAVRGGAAALCLIRER